MSREQWGHGYWKGVTDAKNDVVTEHVDIHEEACYFVARMKISNALKDYDRSLFPVRSLIIFYGLTEEYVKRIYDFILKRNPFGCYVSGPANGPWQDDYFVLPNLSVEECDGIVNVIENKWYREAGYFEQWEKEDQLRQGVKEGKYETIQRLRQG